MITEERVDTFLQEHKRKPTHFNVAPRFGPGSPAMVDREIAMRVARDEEEMHSGCQEGRYGQDMITTAETKGLLGIVELRAETKKGWDVLDVITGERYIRAFKKA